MKIPVVSLLTPIVTHCLILHLYGGTIYTNFLPETNFGRNTKNQPVLDEISMFEDSKDTKGETSILEVFQNDYWGNKITLPHSNKSWRPFTVLTFRWFYAHLKENLDVTIMVNRLFNALLHACNAELVSNIGIQLMAFKGQSLDSAQNVILRAFMKLIFGLHPVSPEVAVNCANRSHSIGLLCSLLAILTVIKAVHERQNKEEKEKCETNQPILLWYGVLYVIWVIGLLSSETIVFHVPAVFITCLAVYLNRFIRNSKEDSLKENEILVSAMKIHLSYFVVILFLTLAYICGRFVFGIASINPELFSIGQHPFYFLSGSKRVINYAYVTCIHILKACYLDPIGIAHEYGFNSVPPLSIEYFEPGYLVLLGTIMSIVGCAVFCFLNGTGTFLHYLVFASWFATLFPITGIVPTGTFIAERLMYPSTVAVAIYGARLLTGLIVVRTSDSTMDFTQTCFRLIVLILAAKSTYIGVHDRICDWCDSTRLLQTTLRNFPNNALSKYDLGIRIVKEGIDHNVTFARELFESALEILPSFCRNHFPLAILAEMRNDLANKEYHLVEAIFCSTTNNDASAYYTKTWTNLLAKTSIESPEAYHQLTELYMNQSKIIKKRMEEQGITKEH